MNKSEAFSNGFPFDSFTLNVKQYFFVMSLWRKQRPLAGLYNWGKLSSCCYMQSKIQTEGSNLNWLVKIKYIVLLWIVSLVQLFFNVLWVDSGSSFRLWINH